MITRSLLDIVWERPLNRGLNSEQGWGLGSLISSLRIHTEYIPKYSDRWRENTPEGMEYSFHERLSTKRWTRENNNFSRISFICIDYSTSYRSIYQSSKCEPGYSTIVGSHLKSRVIAAGEDYLQRTILVLANSLCDCFLQKLCWPVTTFSKTEKCSIPISDISVSQSTR